MMKKFNDLLFHNAELCPKRSITTSHLRNQANFAGDSWFSNSINSRIVSEIGIVVRQGQLTF